MSLLRRTPNQNNNSNGNQNNNNSQQPASNSPAPANNSNQPSSSRFGRGSTNSGNNKKSNPFGRSKAENNDKAQEKSWRYDGTINRFGASEVAWIIAPVNTTFVRFDLNGLGDPFHRVLGTNLDLNHADPANFAKTLEAGGKLVDDITQRLNSSWNDYNMQGAVMMFPWDLMLKGIVAHLPELQQNTSIPNPFEKANDTNKDEEEIDLPSSGMCLRALDMMLIINILGRTKSNILLGNSQLILEDTFINRSLVTNDPRLVQLAQATGCIEEHFDK